MAEHYRTIWERANGPIPSGYVIHHKNGDRGDNHLDNLEMKPSGKHISEHKKHNPTWNKGLKSPKKGKEEAAMTGNELQALLTEAGLNANDLAHLLKVYYSTVWRWLAGTSPIDRVTEIAIRSVLAKAEAKP